MLRACSVDDVPALLPLLEGVMLESDRYKNMTPEYDYVTEQIYFLIEHGIALCVEQDGEIAGVMLGVVSSPWYSSRLEAAEFILAVSKDKRGGWMAVRLIKEFQRLAKEKGAWRMHAGATLGINDWLVKALYRRLGFTDFGNGLAKEL